MLNEVEDKVIIESPKEETVPRKEFKLFNLAITLLDLEKSEPLFAQNCTQLNTVDHKIFYDFFEKHIDETRNGKNTLECTFIDLKNSITSKLETYKAKPDNNSFITLTNELTDNLFTIMKSATRSSGSFFVIHAEYNNEEIIVLLKLDPIDAVQLDKDSLILKKIENILPDSNERVHKCALIKLNYEKEKTHLFVIDKQQKTGEISQFFMGTFLQAAPIPNDKIKTTILIQELYEKISPKLSDSEKENLDYAIDTEVVNGSIINIPNTVNNILSKTVNKDRIDRDIFLATETKEFMNKFNIKYNDFSSNLTVERSDINYTYKATNNQIVFKYNKVLDKSRVFVNIDNDKNEVNIKIKNSDSIDFKKKAK